MTAREILDDDIYLKRFALGVTRAKGNRSSSAGVESVNRQEAYALRARYAATHSVTKGFHTPLHDCEAPLPTLGACTHCGRGYVMLGTEPECWTCGGKTFAAFDDQPTCPASADAAKDKE